MAFNKFMHPRNIYKNPPDFSQLAKEYPEFAKYVITKPSGGSRIDFKDIDALRALTITLLKKDFNLDVDLPPNRLVPTLPLRLNYILWIEDLLEASKLTIDVHAIDIGAKKNKWKFIGTEVNEHAIKWAQKLVEKNNLHEYIEIFKVEPSEVLLNLVNEKQKVFDFCMCNPPFFHEPYEKSQQQRPWMNKGDNAARCEKVYEGGEEMLVRKIVDDSKILKEKVRIYTSMLGKKAAFLEIKHYLHSIQDIQMTTTEFCQGNIKRWGIAWSFIPEMKLNEVKNKKPSKHKNIRHTYVIPCTSEDQYNVSFFKEKVESLLQEMKIFYEVLISESYMVTMAIKATENTWIHQRRKRREMLRQAKNAEFLQNKDTSDEICNTLTRVSSGGEICMKDDNKTNLKRKSDNAYQDTKKPRLDPSESSSSKPSEEEEKQWVLSCKMSLVKVESDINLTLYDCDMSVDPNPMCQLIQFLKNKLK